MYKMKEEETTNKRKVGEETTIGKATISTEIAAMPYPTSWRCKAPPARIP